MLESPKARRVSRRLRDLGTPASARVWRQASDARCPIDASSRRRSLKRLFWFLARIRFWRCRASKHSSCDHVFVGIQLVVAQEYELKSLRIDHPFARATPPGARSAGAYFGIENDASTPDRLVSASSPVAGIVELREMTMDGAVMKMRAISSIEIKARARVERFAVLLASVFSGATCMR
jgi:hypothetical protein